MKSCELESYTSWLLLLDTVFCRLIHVVLCVSSVSFCGCLVIVSLVWLYRHLSIHSPTDAICGVLFTSAAMDFSKEGNSFIFQGGLKASGSYWPAIRGHVDGKRSVRRTTWVKILCLWISVTFKSYWPQSVFRNQSKLHH